MIKTVISTFIIFCCIFVNAQELTDSENKLIDRIKQANTFFTDISSDFVQIKHLSFLGEDVVTQGKFYYTKPDKLSMKYEQPEGDLMLINGDRFVMISGGKRSETTSKANSKMRSMKNILSSCLQGDIRQIGGNRIYCEDGPLYHLITVEIDSKSNKSNINKVKLSYDKRDLTLSVLQTFEPDGSYTIYQLKNKVFNKPIDDMNFQASKK